MGKVIAAVSGKGGTGKTTTVGAVASCLAAIGCSVLAVDFDIGLRNLDITLGMTEYTVSDFTDACRPGTELKDVCSAHPQIENLWFLSAPPEYSSSPASAEDLAALFEKIREEFDFCLIDSPAGIGSGFSLAATFADAAIIVANADPSSIRTAQITAEQLNRTGISDVRLLINRVAGKTFKKADICGDDIIDNVGVQLIGVIREDKSVFFAGAKETPLVLASQKGAAADFLSVARRIAGQNVPLNIK